MSAAGDLLQSVRNYLAACGDAALDRFTAGFDWGMAERPAAPHSLPVVGHLHGATPPIAIPEAGLLAELAGVAGHLHWAQTYSAADFGEDFLARYGWVELFGTRGHFASETMAGGFLLLGPEVHYPDHHHVAEEIYIPLTSHSFWSKDAGPFVVRQAGEIIHHPSNIRHAMRTEKQPLAALYLWRGGPLAQKSIISGKDR